MGLVIDPAALGGLAGLIALASWAVGRMQHAAPMTRRDPAAREIAAPLLASSLATPVGNTASQPPAAGAVCQQRAFEERRALLANPVALAELHAEASAIRRDERIFERVDHSGALVALVHEVYDGGCRFLGRSGQPTCPGPARDVCDAKGGCQALAMRAAADTAVPTDRC